MKKLVSIIYYTGISISALIGFLHFFAPNAFAWYSYIPEAPKEIFAAIEYVNFFISLFLFGLSAILLFMKKRMFAGSAEILVFYVFLVFTWFCRIVISLVIPWPSSLQTWLLAGFGAEFFLMLLPAACLLCRNTKRMRECTDGPGISRLCYGERRIRSRGLR